MKQQRLPYGARSVEELERNRARLGTKWQERELSHEERLTLVAQKVARKAWWDGFSWGWFWGSWQ